MYSHFHLLPYEYYTYIFIKITNPLQKKTLLLYLHHNKRLCMYTYAFKFMQMVENSFDGNQ